MKEIHCYILGRVQGVGYRAWCEKEARKLSLTGWVRNRSDGSVEVFAKGPHDSVDVFLTLLKEGPLFARVHPRGFSKRRAQWSSSIFRTAPALF